MNHAFARKTAGRLQRRWLHVIPHPTGTCERDYYSEPLLILLVPLDCSTWQVSTVGFSQSLPRSPTLPTGRPRAISGSSLACSESDARHRLSSLAASCDPLTLDQASPDESSCESPKGASRPRSGYESRIIPTRFGMPFASANTGNTARLRGAWRGPERPRHAPHDSPCAHCRAPSAAGKPTPTIGLSADK